MKKTLLITMLTLFVAAMQVQAQNWVGSESCKGCHSEKYNDWAASGHPYKFNVVENGTAPEYPAEAINFIDTWMADLTDGSHDWDVVAGVIGGYGWKARFVGDDGHIIGTAGSKYSTGMGDNQINFFGGELHNWSNYHPNDEKIYNYSCFKCHTTGGKQEGTWLEGVDGLGTFTEQGIGCESCHGPGGDHIAGPSSDNIERVYNFAHLDNASGGLTIYGETTQASETTSDVNFLCGTCHNRSYSNPINSSGGFIKHHEQWDEVVSSTHGKKGINCTSCHDPHKRVIWDGDGITKNCTECHSSLTTINHSADLSCKDCHMPYAAKSGTKRGESGYVGDVRSHLLKISVDGETMFTDDSTNVKDDETREAALSLHFACLGCHNHSSTDDIPDKTIEEAMASAPGMHIPVSVSELLELNTNIYPNPAYKAANINVNLNNPAYVSIDIYTTTGQKVYAINNEFRSAGKHTFIWNGADESANTGVYFVKITAGDESQTKKLMLIK